MPEAARRAKRTWLFIAEAGAAAMGMCLFGVFVHSQPPLVLLSGVGLCATAIAIWHFFRTEAFPATTLGLSRPTRALALYAILGCLIGLGLGVAYREVRHWGPFPDALRRFVFVAAAIGATEELLFRGYIQGRVRRLGVVGAVLFAAICHTAYKCALRALPPIGVDTDFRFLATWTFVGGVVFGALRERSRSVLPPLAAHVVFDLIVYGHQAQAPCWVWS